MTEPKEASYRHFRLRREISRRRLKVTIILTSTVMVLEVAGGIVSNSLALLSDAVHMFTHLFAVGISFLAVSIAMKPATKEKSYGFFRAEVLAAFTNGIVLLFVAGFIFYHAIKRIIAPQVVVTSQMFLIAAVGLTSNLITMFILGPAHKKDINLRSAFLHILGDVISSVAVVGAAIFIYFTHNFVIDPILSFLIGMLIVIWALRLLVESGNILLESVPAHLNTDEIISDIVGSIPQIEKLHHVHIWELTSHMYSMTANAVVSNCSVLETQEVLGKLNKLVHDKYGIFHTNIQFECDVKK